jgi:hypothetical protein
MVAALAAGMEATPRGVRVVEVPEIAAGLSASTR